MRIRTSGVHANANALAQRIIYCLTAPDKSRFSRIILHCAIYSLRSRSSDIEYVQLRCSQFLVTNREL